PPGGILDRPQIEVGQRDESACVKNRFDDSSADAARRAGDDDDPRGESGAGDGGQAPLPGQKAGPAVTPPSTTRLAPVIQRAAGEARKRTASATSSSVPIRPSGTASIQR